MLRDRFIGLAILRRLLSGLALGLAAAPSQADTCCAPPTGVVAFYPADGTAEDVRGGHDGTLQNGATFDAGHVGPAFTFDGVDDFVSVPDSTAWDIGASDFTIDLWVKLNAGDKALLIHQQAGAVAGGWEFFYEDDALSVNDTPSTNAISRPFTPTPGQWHHVAATRAAGTLRLYIDGQQAGAAQPGTPAFPDVAGPLRIGSYANGGDYELDGQIDELTLHDRALSAAEVQSVFEAGSAGRCTGQLCSTPPAGLVAWYRGENDVADSQRANDGSLQHGATFAAGHVGQALSFDGADDGAIIPDAPDLSPTGQITVSAWVRPSDNEDGVLVSKFTPGQPLQYQLSRLVSACIGQAAPIPAGNFAIALRGMSELPNDCFGWTDSNAHLPVGAFSHVAVTYDGAMVRTFVNGTLTRSIPATGLINSGSSPLVLGHTQEAGGSSFFAGLLDETQVYARALSPAEVKELFDAGAACADCGSQPGGTVAWYKGDGDARDSAGTNDGALTGGMAASADAMVNQGFQSNGSGQGVVLANAAALQRQDFSIAGWIKRSSATRVSQDSCGGLLFGYGQDGYGLGIGDGSCGTPPGKLLLSKVGSSNVSSGSVGVDDTAFHHVAVTTSGGEVFFYVDGIADGPYAYAPGYTFGTTPAVGFRADTGANSFEGLIDEMQFFDRALSGAEIERIFRAGSRGTCADGIPDVFAFPNQTNVPPNAMVESAVLTLGGFDGPAPVTVLGGQYRIDGGIYLSTPGTLRPGQTLQLRLTSAATVSTNRNMSVTVGGVTGRFVTKTRAAPGDIHPDAFGFANRSNVPVGAQVLSNVVTPVGYDSSAPISIDSGEFSVGGGPFTAGPGTIAPGQTLQLRTTAPATNATKFELAVTIGATKGKWVGKTVP